MERKGSGTYGIVYNEGDGRVVKVTSKEDGHEATIKEVAALQACGDAVTPLYTVAVGRTKVRMRLKDCGTDLWDLALELNLAQRLELLPTLFWQLACAACHMADCGVVHGDLKCSNVMWHAQERRLRIIDFGIASFERAPLNDDSCVDSVRLCGTHYYQPPEAVLHGRLSNRGMAWCLAMVLGGFVHAEVVVRPLLRCKDNASSESAMIELFTGLHDCEELPTHDTSFERIFEAYPALEPVFKSMLRINTDERISLHQLKSVLAEESLNTTRIIRAALEDTSVDDFYERQTCIGREDRAAAIDWLELWCKEEGCENHLALCLDILDRTCVVVDLASVSHYHTYAAAAMYIACCLFDTRTSKTALRLAAASNVRHCQTTTVQHYALKILAHLHGRVYVKPFDLLLYRQEPWRCIDFKIVSYVLRSISLPYTTHDLMTCYKTLAQYDATCVA